MGALSSWSVFALTHHALIQYCASRLGISSFSDYVVLGDDVAIFNTEIAKRYQKLMTHLGVEISISKSLTWLPGSKQWPYAEFAKQIICDGTPITPIPYDLMHTFCLNPVKEYFTLRYALNHLGIDISRRTPLDIAEGLSLKKTERNHLEILHTTPSTLMGKNKRTEPTAFCEEGEGPWSDLDLNLVPSVLMELLFKEYYSKICDIQKVALSLSHYDKIAEQLSEMSGRFQVKKPVLQALSQIPIRSGQPLPMVIHQKRTELLQLTLRGINSNASTDWQFPEVQGLWKGVLHATEDLFSAFTDKKSQLSRVQSVFIIKVYKALKRGYHPKLQATMEEVLDSSEDSQWEDVWEK